MTYRKIDQLEAEWTRARRRLDLARAYEDDDEEYFDQEEQDARDALDEAKEELSLCGVVGCHNSITWHVLCDMHRKEIGG